MRGYEQPSRPCTPREHLERERQRIAELTAEFLTAGGEIQRPGPRQIRLEVPTDRRATTTRVYTDGTAPPALDVLTPNSRAQRRRRTPQPITVPNRAEPKPMNIEHADQNESEKLINKQQLRSRIPVSETTIWRWERDGILKPVHIAGRPFYRKADIDELVANGHPSTTKGDQTTNG